MGNSLLRARSDSGDNILWQNKPDSPVSVQAFYRSGSFLGVSLSGFGISGVYDFDIEGPFTPYAGLGLQSVSVSVAGRALPVGTSGGTGIHILLGGKYAVIPDWDVELGWNSVSGITIGGSYNL